MVLEVWIISMIETAIGWLIFFCLWCAILIYFARIGRKRNDRFILSVSFLLCFFFSCASVIMFDVALELQIFFLTWFLSWSYVDLFLLLDSKA